MNMHPQVGRPPKIFIIHENPEWVDPLLHELDAMGTPYENWLSFDAATDLGAIPPEGVFYSKVSASAYSRDHTSAPALSMHMVQWLEWHGRRVINGRHTIETEVSKARQILLLAKAGIRTPRTFVANSKTQVLTCAQQLNAEEVIVKPNCGGKGLGVHLFRSLKSLQEWLESPDVQSVDGLYIIQEYIRANKPQVVRMEFVGGQFQYALGVDTSHGFELCPADACEIPEPGCVATDHAAHKFEVLELFGSDIVSKLERFLQEQRIDIAGIEYIEDIDGVPHVYDINTNTNYNTAAEARAGIEPGMKTLAKYLRSELAKHYPESAPKAMA